MKHTLPKIWQWLLSWPAMIILLTLYAIAMAAATFIEANEGTAAARADVYYALWFFALQLLLTLNLVGRIVLFGFIGQRKWASLTFHLSFIVILAGALTTHITGREGIMHIREGESASTIYTDNGRTVEDVPFSATLNDFRIIFYPGSSSPSSYESDITISGDGATERATVSMNNILYFNGYRIYQSSYDKDMAGTVLTVNYDRWGTAISYAGYFLLIVGMVMALFHRQSRFRHLTRSLSRLSSATRLSVALALALGTLSASAAERSTDHSLRQGAVSADHASKFGALPVQNYDGRLEPMNTFSSKLLRKIAKTDTWAGMNSDQIILGITTNPMLWSNAPIIALPNDMLAKQLSLTGDFASYNEMFGPDGRYLLSDDVEKAFAREAKMRDKSDKDLIKLDERVNIMYALMTGNLLNLFPLPNDPAHHWFSAADDLSRFTGRDSLFVSKIMPWYTSELEKSVATGNWAAPDEIVGMIKTYQRAKSESIIPDEDQIAAELFYNKARIFNTTFKLYLIVGFLLLIVLMGGLLGWSGRWIRVAVGVFYGAVIGIFLWHTFGLGLRWYIAGYAPWSNAYESMVYVGWATALAGLIFSRRSPMVLALATMLAGVVLFVSNLNWMDPEITPLVPVLKSYWLMVHVAVITASYGFFGISALIGIVSLTMMAIRRRGNATIGRSLTELTIINELSLIIGTILLTAGIFFGAVWANESWGRYWGWDPKETWALITMVAYVVVLHSRFLPILRGAYVFNLLSVISFATVLMTYFGVNFYLSGMHSYGSTEGFSATFLIWIAVAIVILATVAAIRNKDENDI